MSGKRIVKVALGQLNMIPGDTAINLGKMLDMIDRASAEGADIIVFPELSYTGYFLDNDETHRLAESVDGYMVQQLRKKSHEKHIHIIAGYVETENKAGTVYNSCIFIDDQGNILENKRKVYAWGDEKRRFAPGNKFPVIDTKFGKIGMLICYEMEFPEPARIEMLKGAELIIVCAAFTDKVHWNFKLKANAVYNQVFVLGVNSVENRCFGSSVVYAPDGELLVEAGNEEELMIQTIDVEKVQEIRRSIPYLSDFRKDTFSLNAVNIY